ncbi:MAG: C10 family peptidase [Prevotella sp.]|nr:C10 family peptidase [Prevotella sp.]
MKSLVASLLMTCCIGAYAAPIDQGAALKLAGEFFAKNPAKGSSAMKVVHKVAVKSNASASVENNLFYVINRGENNGFVIVAGDDRVMPILAFSDEGCISDDGIRNNPGMRWLFGEYEDQITWALQNVPDRPAKMTARKASNYTINIQPLLAYENDRLTKRATPISWGQSWPFNAYAPKQNNRSCYAGCVATGISTAMRWHKWPNKAKGKVSYTWNRQTLSLNFDGSGSENAAYNWAQMPAGITSGGVNRETNQRVTDVQADNIGRLLRDVGYAIKMAYSTSGSGAYVYDWRGPAVQNFGYKSGISWVQRSRYTKQQWMDAIEKELRDNGPVVFAGYSSGGGHCFNIDGTATNGYVHVDWGWTGSENGWYSIDVMEPGSQGIGGGSGGYSTGQELVLNMIPDRGNNPNPDPNPDPTPAPGSSLYIAAMSTKTQVYKANNQSIPVTMGNNHQTGTYSGQLALCFRKSGENQAVVVATASATISARGTKLVQFNANLANREVGSYELIVAYADGSSYKAINASAGNVTLIDGENPNPEPDPQPVQGFNLAIPVTTNATATEGSSTKIEFRIQNNGDANYSDYLYLYAVPSSGYSSTMISSGDVNIVRDQTATITFYTNSSFSSLSAGTYNLKVAYLKNGKTSYINLSNYNTDVVGTLTIERGYEPDPDPYSGGDASMYTAYLYQNNQYIGTDYARVYKYYSTFKVRYYVYSRNGFNGKVKAFIASSYRGTSPISSYMAGTGDISIAAGQYAYVDVTYPTSYLYNGYYYYAKIAFSNDGYTYQVDSDYVPFYVYSSYYYATYDDNNTYEGISWGPSYNINESNDMSKYLYQSVGIEVDDESVTGIDNVSVTDAKNAKVSGIFNLNGQRVNENYKGIVIENGKKVMKVK